MVEKDSKEKTEGEITREYNGIPRKSIHFGIVTIMKYVNGDTPLDQGQFVVDRALSKKLIAQDLRKIVLSKKDEMGYDILYSYKGEPFEYSIPDFQQLGVTSPVNNMIIIRDAEPIGDLLGHIGVHKEITARDLKAIKKLILGHKINLNMLPHTLKLTPNGIINFSKLESVNEQSISLFEYKSSDVLPTRPRKIEKVYAKYFK